MEHALLTRDGVQPDPRVAALLIEVALIIDTCDDVDFDAWERELYAGAGR
jgi:hypothetical protein